MAEPPEVPYPTEAEMDREYARLYPVMVPLPELTEEEYPLTTFPLTPSVQGDEP